MKHALLKRDDGNQLLYLYVFI